MAYAETPLWERLGQFPATAVATAAGVVYGRRASSPGCNGALTHVLLHGIGSGSGSWLAQLAQAQRPAQQPCHVVAWDAPGYGGSDALAPNAPRAADYAQRFWAWLDALQYDSTQPFTLVGHSLGALMAAAAAVQRPTRVHRLVLLSPAQGYARSSAAVRDKKLSDRLDALAQFGPAGMAHRRASAMLSPHADAQQITFVEQMMAGIEPHGYAQAARMLANADILADLAQLHCPITVASGAADTVTPMDACRTLALQIGAPYLSLGEVGHSCALEAAGAVNELLGMGEGEL